MPPKSEYDGSKWKTLRELWKQANPTKLKASCDKEYADFWNLNKSSAETIDRKISDLRVAVQIRKYSNPLLLGFRKQVRSTITCYPESPADLNHEGNIEDDNSPDEARDETENEETESAVFDNQVTTNSAPTPKQDLIKFELAKKCEEELLLRRLQDGGHNFSREQAKRLETLKNEISNSKKKLKKRELNKKAAKKSRKTKLKAVPQIKRGRPSIDRDQPALLDTILDIVSQSGSTDERRRTESLRTCTTVNKLLEELKLQGFNISRSGLYLRFLPRNCKSIEGKKHISTVPVKLLKAQNNLRKSHQDSHFAAAQVKHLKNLASMFGEQNVIVISQDDKSKIPIGITAAKMQGPLLMKLDYRIRLPDHNWVVASKHKLIPSVYAGLVFKEDLLTYSGPTYIAIRSGKHDSSTAAAHSKDLLRFLSLPEFAYFCKRDGETKPILIILVDGGPDQNPSYPKTLLQAMKNFIRLNLDALFIATHAPYQSASNPVERRMAPLSKQLCGVILPFDHYGNHLNASQKTIDKNLEIRNFARAGQVLKSLWHDLIIDGHNVFAEYVHPPGTKQFSDEELQIDTSPEIPGTNTVITGFDTGTPEEASDNLDYDFNEQWKSTHVRQSQYCIQIVKCQNRFCCGIPRTNLRDVLPDGFLPPPILYIRSNSGIQCAPVNSKDGHFFDLLTRLALNTIVPPGAPIPIPNDFYCPSAQGQLSDRICPNQECGIAFATKTSKKIHEKMHIHDKFGIQGTSTSIGISNIEREIDEIVVIDDIDAWWFPIFTQTSDPNVQV